MTHWLHEFDLYPAEHGDGIELHRKKGGNKMKHTPGPWKIVTRTDDEGRIVIGTDGQPYSIRQATPGEPPWPIADCSSEADARLIAAAPDLLAAAQLTLSMLNDMTTEDFRNGADKPLRDALQVAIAKAEGRE